MLLSERVMFVPLAVFFLVSIGALGQTFRGNLAGVVTDPSDAAIPNAAIRLDSPSTALTRTSVSATNGSFLLAELPVGMYTLTVTVPGFEAKKVDNKVDNINIEVSMLNRRGGRK